MIAQLEAAGKWGPDERRLTSGAIRHNFGSQKWHERRRVLITAMWKREFDPPPPPALKKPRLSEMIDQLTAAGEMPAIERMIVFLASNGVADRDRIIREQWVRLFGS